MAKINVEQFDSNLKNNTGTQTPATNVEAVNGGLRDDQPSEEHKKRQKQAREPHGRKWYQSWRTFLTCGIIGLLGGIALMLIGVLMPREELADLIFPEIPSKVITDEIYSPLTGEVVESEAEQVAATYCIQTPNGTDGARPQAGLTEAGVIFEAIAEAGITRFAAIYQNPTSSIIGPIRSLRSYYLEWDVPFDCTIVHAGGSGDALAALRAGGYRDLDENYTYMYRGTYGTRLWNNLFTTADNLRLFAENSGYKTSKVSGFKRLSPAESEKSRVDNLVGRKFVITESSSDLVLDMDGGVREINLNFGSAPSFNVVYTYNGETNSYDRSYASGYAHEVYKCPTENLGEKNPEDYCNLVQMSPSVVIAMVVDERRAADNYHEDITTIGSGTAYIFQNATAVRGSWSKTTRNDQIKFFDENGAEMALAPGQTFISAIPGYGSVDF